MSSEPDAKTGATVRRTLHVLAAYTNAVERGKTVRALSVARMKSFYDGTLFYKLAQQRE